jgi:hypothetical protein
VPAAFLLWSGHVTIVVWMAVLVGMCVAHGPRPFEWFTDARRAPRVAALIACALFVASGFRLEGLIPGGDEPHYLVITQSLLRDGDLRIENNHVRGDYREYFSGRLAPDYLRRGKDGQIYSIHAPGLPAVIAPAFALFGYRGVVLFLSIVAAIGTALLWRVSYSLTRSAGAAWFGWASGALTVPFFFQSFAIYPDGVAATIVLFAIVPLVEEPRAIDRRRWMAIGAALALLPWLHTRFSVLAGAIGAVLVLRLVSSREGRSRLASLLVLPVVSALAWFGFFYVIYGTFSPSAPYGTYTQSAPANILNGLPALFFDQQFGALPYAPVYALCMFGLLTLARHHLRLAVEVATIAVPYLLVTAMYHMWWAGGSSPARFAVPLLLLLAVPGAWLWHDARHAATRGMAIALLVASAGISLSLVVVDAGRLAYNFRDGYSLAAERLSPIVDLPRGMPSFFRQSPAGAVARATIWLAAMWSAWLALRVVERRLTGNVRAALALATPACLAAAVMMALSIEWRFERVDGATAATSQLALLSAYDQRMRPVGVTLAPLTIQSSATVLPRIAIATPTRRPEPSPRTLLIAPGIVPAGEYELRPGGSDPPLGIARLIIGRLARPIYAWNLATDLSNRAAIFELPVNVGSLVIEGDTDRAGRTGLVLVPRRINGRPSTDAYARRAERYGSALAYFFGDDAFPEEPGFWIRGGGDSTIAVMPAERGVPLQLFIRNAPVQNKLRLEIDGGPQTFDLQPGEERVIPLLLPAERPAALIRFRPETGFRPSEVERGSTDSRFLGTWIELRER